MISSAPGLQPPRFDANWVCETRHVQKPMPISYHHGVEQPGALMPVESADAVVVCGFIGCGLRPFNPVIAALPRLMHLPTQRGGAWVRVVIQQAAAESRSPGPGSQAILARMSEMLFVDAVRRYVESLPEQSAGWLAGMSDRYVARALALLHEGPAEPWTIDTLAGRVALYEHFVHFVSQPPMQYLTNWRMQLASNLLCSSSVNVAAIALDVGYESEAAFARAFKRATGMPPAAWRRARAQS